MTSPPRVAPRSSTLVPPVAAVLLGLFVHGLQASALGLYWDDAVQLMRPLQALDYEAAAFVATDTAWSLMAERPASYFAFAITRVVFLAGLAPVHWALVGIFLMTVVVLTRVARRVLDRDWFVFAAGGTFALGPSAPLQTIWPATIHYHVSCLAALTAVLAALRFMESLRGGRAGWLAAAATFHATSLLTHEGFAFLPPAFLAGYAVVAHARAARPGSANNAESPASAAARALGVLLAVMALYAAWRILLLPLYGAPNNTAVLDLFGVARNAVVGAFTVLVPWRDVAAFLYEARPAGIWIACSVAAGVAAWLISMWLWARDTRRSGEDAGAWSDAACVGVAMFGAGVVAVALSPVPLRALFGVDFRPRANFVVTPGLALSVPALLVLLVRGARRAPALAAVIAVAALLWVGLVGMPGGGESLLSYRSHSPVLFGRYSIAYGLLVALYGMAVLGTAMAAIALARRGRAARSGGSVAAVVAPLVDRSGRLAVIGLFAGFVMMGSLVHFAAKQRFVEEWARQRALIQDLRRLAPGLADETFVVVVDDRGVSHPWATHDDVVAYLRAVYENPSVMGNTLAHLRFHPDGVESTYHGDARWVPPSGGRVSYDRLVLFEYVRGVLRPLPEIEVLTVAGDRLIVRTNMDRVRPGGAPMPSRMWRHVGG